MNNTSEQQQIITQQASAWYARLRSPQVTQQDQSEFNQWLNQNPAHLQEYQELDAFWDELDIIALTPSVQQAKHIRRRKWLQSFKTLKYWWVAPVSAACLVLVASGYGLKSIYWNSLYYQSALGEQRTIELKDRSLVTLNTQTTLKVDYSFGERRIELITGQAYFEVAPDPGRPFIVATANNEVKALGTAFDIYQANDRVTITLLEGEIEVSPLAPSTEAAPVRLIAGQQVICRNSDKNNLVVTSANMQQVSAWRHSKLEFDNTPLAQAVAEANRYSPVKIVLIGDSLEQARISGSFPIRRNDLLAEGVQNYFDLKLTRPKANVILLQKK